MTAIYSPHYGDRFPVTNRVEDKAEPILTAGPSSRGERRQGYDEPYKRRDDLDGVPLDEAIHQMFR